MSELKGKKILITSGPTWVAIDKVRVISNIATGKVGGLIADEAKKAGAQVTLLQGQVKERLNRKNIRVIKFKYFSDFYMQLRKELTSKKYDIVIHSAAVSDYSVKKFFSGKIRSGLSGFKLELKPTIKIVNRIKKISNKSILVAFKLGIGISRASLIKNAVKLLKSSKADLVVANRISGDKYTAFIIDKKSNILNSASNKKQLSVKLINMLNRKI